MEEEKYYTHTNGMKFRYVKCENDEEACSKCVLPKGGQTCCSTKCAEYNSYLDFCKQD